MLSTPYAITTSQFIPCPSPNSDRSGKVVIDVYNPNGAVFTVTVVARGQLSPRPLDQTHGAPAPVTNYATGAAVANSQITADGIYTVPSDGVLIGLQVVLTSGTGLVVTPGCVSLA